MQSLYFIGKCTLNCNADETFKQTDQKICKQAPTSKIWILLARLSISFFLQLQYISTLRAFSRILVTFVSSLRNLRHFDK